jgi:hypothetical protein
LESTTAITPDIIAIYMLPERWVAVDQGKTSALSACSRARFTRLAGARSSPMNEPERRTYAVGEAAER